MKKIGNVYGRREIQLIYKGWCVPPQMLLITDASKTISCLHMPLGYVGSASWMCFKKKVGGGHYCSGFMGPQSVEIGG